jgi:hypothetical protein
MTEKQRLLVDTAIILLVILGFYPGPRVAAVGAMGLTVVVAWVAWQLRRLDKSGNPPQDPAARRRSEAPGR